MRGRGGRDRGISRGEGNSGGGVGLHPNVMSFHEVGRRGSKHEAHIIVAGLGDEKDVDQSLGTRELLGMRKNGLGGFRGTPSKVLCRTLEEGTSYLVRLLVKGSVLGG